MNEPVPASVIDYLNNLTPGFFPFELFQSITRLTVSPILELIPLRTINGKVEVLMLKRPLDDPHWPGMLHTPGTYIRTTDTEITLQSAFDRLVRGELELQIDVQTFFVQTIFHQVNRGMELGLVYGMDLSGINNFPKGEWFPVDDLPDTSVKTQHEMIKNAVLQLV
ncbi:hypothetical protein KBD71_01375 [Candidatus Woesebacteria bacterium]|nr:hypothetical protein [Candidatus Woesebacteria bacterium]